MKVVFYNGRKKVGAIICSSAAQVVNYWLTHTDVPEWTRYKIYEK